MKYQIQEDVNWDCPIQDYLIFLDKYNAKIYDFITSGPGGGNPCITIEFKSLEDANKYCIENDFENQYIQTID